ncbi:MAG TPA: hypothetical protein DEP25_03405, partial [Candidatus Taylorbacteria bacterium]|nr:hypothetical protein [Candidatus Taylorbacteria bacterium]
SKLFRNNTQDERAKSFPPPSTPLHFLPASRKQNHTVRAIERGAEQENCLYIFLFFARHLFNS